MVDCMYIYMCRFDSVCREDSVLTISCPPSHTDDSEFGMHTLSLRSEFNQCLQKMEVQENVIPSYLTLYLLLSEMSLDPYIPKIFLFLVYVKEEESHFYKNSIIK